MKAERPASVKGTLMNKTYLLVILTFVAMMPSTVCAFRDDDLKADNQAAYRAAVVHSAVVGAVQADQEEKRLEELEPRLTESQRRDLQKCRANGMVYVNPGVGCRSDGESR